MSSSRGRGGRGNAARAAAIAPAETERRGLWGWFQDSGEWIGDKASDAAEAVGSAARQVADTAGDVWDVATSSDVDLDWSSRRLTVDTDLDEVMDLMPPGVQAALQLDRVAADNRVRAVYDHRAGTVTLTSEVIEIAGVQTDTLTTGPVSLRGVRLVLSNPGGGVPFVGEDTGVPLWTDSEDNLTSELTVEGLTAADVVLQQEGGPVRLDRVELTDLTGSAQDNEGDLGGEGTIAGFSVSGAILEGVQAQGVSVDRLEGADVSAGVSAPGESAFLAAGSLTATGASRDGTSLGAASLTGARVDVHNAGGGLPLLDATPDTNLGASVTARAASISDFDSATTDLGGATVSDLSGSWSGTSASVQAGGASVSGVDTSTVDARSAALSGLSATVDWGNGLRAGVRSDSAEVTGLSGIGGTLDRVSASGLSADLSPEATGVGADRIDLAGARYGDASLDSATILDASAGMVGDERRVVAREATASGARYGDRLAADSLALSQFDLSSAGGETTLGADVLRGSGITNRDGEVTGGAGSIEATGTRATFGTGGMQGGMDRLVATDVAHGDFGAGRAELRNLGVGHQDGETTVDARGFTLDALATPWLDATQLSGSGGSVRLDGDTMDAALDQASLQGGTIADRIAVDSASLEGLTASRSGNTAGLGVGSASVTGVRDSVTGAQAGSASLSDLSLDKGEAVTTASLGALDASDLSGAGASAASVAARRGRVRLEGDEMRGGVDTLMATDVGVGDQLSVGSTSVTGLAATSDASGMNAAFSTADLSDVRARTDGSQISAGSVSARAGAVRRDGETGRLAGGLGALDATDLRGSFAGGGGGAGPSPDMASLVRSGSALVDDASLRASVGLNPGDVSVLTVDPGTRVDASVGIQDGRVMPGATGAEFSRPIDGPLWTSANGVYVTDDGKVKADVSGWFDHNITSMINEATGVQGGRLGTVGQMGAGVADGLGASSGSSGGESGMIDTSSASANGWVSLREGTLDGGEFGSASFARPTQAGDNTVRFDYDGGELGVASDRIVLDGVQSSAVSAGGTSIDDARFSSDGSGSSQASVSRLRAEDLRFSQ